PLARSVIAAHCCGVPWMAGQPAEAALQGAPESRGLPCSTRAILDRRYTHSGSRCVRRIEFLRLPSTMLMPGWLLPLSAVAELMPRCSQPRGIFFSRYRRYHVCQSSRALLALVMSPGTSATTGALSVGNSAIASSSPADFAKRSINSDGASATTASSRAVRVSRRRWLRSRSVSSFWPAAVRSRLAIYVPQAVSGFDYRPRDDRATRPGRPVRFHQHRSPARRVPERTPSCGAEAKQLRGITDAGCWGTPCSDLHSARTNLSVTLVHGGTPVMRRMDASSAHSTKRVHARGGSGYVGSRSCTEIGKS